jgi:hypothetical protein
MNWTDTQFHEARKIGEKVPLLLTIPCAILPILMACATFLSLPFEPMLFKGDHWAAGLLYVLYLVGLGLSFKRHRQWLPLLLFTAHILILWAYVNFTQDLLIGYLSVLSLIGTSVLNQYYRLGVWGCQDFEHCSNEPSSTQVSTSSINPS